MLRVPVGRRFVQQRTSVKNTGFQLRTVMQASWPFAIVIALCIGLWAPRLKGPIDLRWDASVYYLLGTSLATGQGYRILSEPGAPEAIQYPPLLPAVVALYERALGSSDSAVVGPWLRRSYAALFLVYGVLVLMFGEEVSSSAICGCSCCSLPTPSFHDFSVGRAFYRATIRFGQRCLRALGWQRYKQTMAVVARGGFLLACDGRVSSAYSWDRSVRCLDI